MFIEESSTQTVRDILNKQIEKKTTFSYDLDFKPLDGNPEVIICSFEKPTIDEKENRLWKKQDNAALFKRDKKYKTYGYLYNLVTNVYTISQEGQLIVPPLPQAALTVTGDFRLYFSTRYLPQDGSPHASEAELNSTELRGCSLNIDKNEFIAKDSKIGFVFVKDSTAITPTALKDYINDTGLKKGEFCNPNATEDVVVYTLDEEIKNGTTGPFIAPGDALVQVGKPMFEVARYHIYAWLQNSEAINGKKDVFVSTAAKEFTIDLAGFQGFVDIKEFTTRTVGSTGLMIKDPNPDHNDGTGLAKNDTFASNYLVENTKMIGYIVCRGGATKPTLEGLLDIVGPNIDGESGRIVNCPRKDDRTFVAGCPNSFSSRECLYLPYNCRHSDFEYFYQQADSEKIQTSIWLVVANERSVAVTSTNVNFTYFRAGKKAPEPEFIARSEFKYNYYLEKGTTNLTRKEKALGPSAKQEALEWQGTKPKNHTTKDELIELANQHDHNQSIYEALDEYFKRDNEAVKLGEIITFIQAMN